MPLKQRIAAVLLCVVWATEVVRMLHPFPLLAGIGAASLGVFTLIAWLRSSRHIQALLAVALAISAAMAWSMGSAETLADGFARAVVFGAFMPSVLLLRATVESSPRIERLQADLGRLDPAQAQNWTLYGSHALGAVLNVGASAILAPVVTCGVDERRRAELAASAARGVALGAMWSPFFLSVAFTTQLAPHVPMWQVVGIGIVTALLGFAASQAVVTPGLRWRGFRDSVAGLVPLAAPSAVIVGAVVGASIAFHWSGLQAVVLVVPLLCAVYLVRLGPLGTGLVGRRAFASLGRVADELVIVVGGTVLGAVVGSMPAVRELGASVTPQMISGPWVIAAMVAIMVLLGNLGLHPIVASSVMVPVVVVGDFGVTDLVAVSSAVFAWGLNGGLSIWSLPMAMSAAYFGIPTPRLISRRGLLYVTVLGVAGVLLLSAVNAALLSLGHS